MGRLATTVAACALTWAYAARVSAGGFDTPVLYTAEHQGMGGTAIGFVDDPSAAFHNPAGLQGVEGFAFVADFSPLFAHTQATPDAGPDARSIESELIFGPFFMAGVAYRVHEWVTVGLAVFPVGSGSAEFRYDNVAGVATQDETEIVFLEGTPLVSVNVPRDLLLPGRLSVGIGYRIDQVSFTRLRGPPGDPVIIDLDLSGESFTGFRVGAQWRPSDALGVGIAFRSKVEIDATADSGIALAQPVIDPELTFVLPAKLGAGVRYDFEDLGLGLAADLEYGFYSQNDVQPLRGEIGGMRGEVANVFDWRDAVTVRAGAEYRLGRERQFPLRIGYVFDDQVTSERFPSAFGTPPTPTHSLTAGAGWRVMDELAINLAYVYRFGSVTVSDDGLAPASECRFCSLGGDYEVTAHGVYVSVNGDFGGD